MSINLFSLIPGPQQDYFYTKNVALFLNIFARFEDVFGNRWAMGLCYVYDDIAGWVLAAGTKDHNYHRREI
jgi:hypothetical protein